MESLDHVSENNGRLPLQWLCWWSVAQCGTRRTHRGHKSKAGARKGLRSACAPRSSVVTGAQVVRREGVPGKLKTKGSRKGSVVPLQRTASIVQRRKAGEDQREDSMAEREEEAPYKRICAGSQLRLRVPSLPCRTCRKSR